MILARTLQALGVVLMSEHIHPWPHRLAFIVGAVFFNVGIEEEMK